MVIGAACSEVFSGTRLHEVLSEGFEYEKIVMESLATGSAASPLSIHTSAGVPLPLDAFIDTLKDHVPWSGDADSHDWFVSLQAKILKHLY